MDREELYWALVKYERSDDEPVKEFCEEIKHHIAMGRDLSDIDSSSICDELLQMQDSLKNDEVLHEAMKVVYNAGTSHILLLCFFSVLI